MFASRNRLRGPSSATTTFLLLAAAGLGACQHGANREPASAGRPRPDDATILERDEITVDGVSNVVELIDGRLSGVRVVRSRGGIWFEIRGPSTFAGSPEALVMVDGVESSAHALLGMSPKDVERVQVLKGANAGRYGIRGANGALVITTRRAR